MVAGYHLIWTVYGYWLPNDPRGSTSTEVRLSTQTSLIDISPRDLACQAIDVRDRWADRVIGRTTRISADRGSAVAVVAA